MMTTTTVPVSSVEIEEIVESAGDKFNGGWLAVA